MYFRDLMFDCFDGYFSYCARVQKDNKRKSIILGSLIKRDSFSLVKVQEIRRCVVGQTKMVSCFEYEEADMCNQMCGGRLDGFVMKVNTPKCGVGINCERKSMVLYFFHSGTDNDV